MRLTICAILLVAVYTSCLRIEQAKQQALLAQEDDTITIFLTGSELGALKPCGCSGGQLGGLDRRSAILDKVPENARLIIDTGSFVETDQEQDLIKFRIIIEAFELLDYDIVNLTNYDIELTRKLGLLDNLESAFDVISSLQPSESGIPFRSTRNLSVKGMTVNITIASFDTESGQLDKIAELFPDSPNGQTLNILILSQYDTAVLDTITNKIRSIDCVVYSGDSDEPMVLSDSQKRPLIFSVGRFGRYVSVLRMSSGHDSDDAENQLWKGSTKLAQASLPGTSQLKLCLFAVPVTEDLPQKSALVQLYRQYQELIRESNLLEKYPRIPLPDGLQYVGSDVCKHCHWYEYEEWSARPHARAYETLEQVGSQYDPECVICHVVGMDYESGFISEGKTPRLKDVGCENCHGPGLEHVRTWGLAKTTEPQLDCLDCHTPERSTEYAGNEQRYQEEIIHWWEPNAVSGVQK